MNYEISMTPQAKADLRSIYQYITFDLQFVTECDRSTSPFGKKHNVIRADARTFPLNVPIQLKLAMA